MNFSKNLLNWYEKNKRDLIFRDDQDPYKIWISEIMAQQTQIASMLPYYERWMQRFPNVESLAAASLEEVLKMWEGLGYYRRARYLHEAAQYLMKEHQGQLPQSRKELLKIPGIGPYTSAAIASIAFELPHVPIDGNVQRVLARYLGYEKIVSSRKAQETFESFLEKELLNSKSQPSQFAQAVMELGALVCKPQDPLCQECPLQKGCIAFKENKIQKIPKKKKAKKLPQIKKAVFIYQDKNKILISQDDQDGLMQGLYRLPQIDGHLKEKEILSLRHKFSHLEWLIKVYPLEEIIDFDFTVKLIALEDLKKIPLVRAHQKILELLDLI